MNKLDAGTLRLFKRDMNCALYPNLEIAQIPLQKMRFTMHYKSANNNVGINRYAQVMGLLVMSALLSGCTKHICCQRDNTQVNRDFYYCRVTYDPSCPGGVDGSPLH